SALSPEAGAGCGNAARPDLWRGLRAIVISTPTRPSGGTSLARARAASHLTASRRGFIVVYHTEGGTADAEHEGLSRAATPARGEDHRQDLAPRARRRQGDGGL